MESVKEFFEKLPERVPPDKAAGMTNSYVFEIENSGAWLVAVADGKVTVTEGDGQADAHIKMSEETFRKVVARELNPLKGFMTRKIKIDGDMAAATKLGKLFG